eukprot:gene18176-21145_t
MRRLLSKQQLMPWSPRKTLRCSRYGCGSAIGCNPITAYTTDMYKRLHVDQCHRMVVHVDASPILSDPAHGWTYKDIPDVNVASISDVVRLIILYENGGVYVDEDVLVVRDLSPYLRTNCEWIASQNNHYFSNHIMMLKPRSNNGTFVSVESPGSVAGSRPDEESRMGVHRWTDAALHQEARCVPHAAFAKVSCRPLYAQSMHASPSPRLPPFDQGGVHAAGPNHLRGAASRG